MFVSFILQNHLKFLQIAKLSRFFDTPEEVDALHWIFSILIDPNITVETFNNFILIYYWDNIFVFLYEPNLRVLNEVALYLSEEERKNKNHIFLIVHIKFYAFLSEYFKKKVSVKWLNQVFAKLLLFSYYEPKMSD